jgi:hypothetical protein
VHESVYAADDVNAPVDSLPDVTLSPDHAPVALQVSAFVVDQLSVDSPPLCTLVGDAVSSSVGSDGAAATTSTVTRATAPPPSPLQLNVNVCVVCSGSVRWLPFTG